MIRRFALCCLMAVLAGCASVQTPSAKVTHVVVTGQGAAGASLRVTVKLHNPNDVVLPLVHAQYRIDVAGLKPFSFDRTPDVSLPAHGDQTLQLTAGFPLDHGTIGGRTYDVSGFCSVQPPGKMWQIFHQSGVPLPAAHFSAAGRLPLGQ